MAFRNALAAFRTQNPDVVIEGFNGFGGTLDSTSYPFPFKDPVDLLGEQDEDYIRVIWAGLSWAAGEVRQRDLRPGVPVTITFESTEKDPVDLKGHLYVVRY